MIERKQPHIMCLQEIWHPRTSMGIPGYNTYLKTRPKGRGGGLGIFIRKDITHSLIEEKIDANLELQILETSFGKDTFLIINAYIPPKGDKIRAIADVQEILTRLNPKQFILCGDLNIDSKCMDKEGLALLELEVATKSNLINDFPTRNDQSKRVIDHILYGSNKDYTFNIITTDYSDHMTLCFQMAVDVKTSKQDTEILEYRPFTKKNIAKFKKLNTDTDWNRVFKKNITAEDAFLAFDSSLQKNMNKACPLKTKRVQKTFTPKPWFNAEIEKSKRKKIKLHKRWLKKRSPIAWEKYVEQRRLHNDLLKKTKSTYYNKELDKAECPKDRWKLAKELLGGTSKSKEYPETMITAEGTTNDEKKIANAFNSYFASVGPELAKSIPQNNQDYMEFLKKVSKPKTTFEFREVTENEIRKIIKTMKNKTSSSFDNLSNKVLKQISETIIEPLTYIINLSLKTSSFPENWKTAKIIPLHKSGKEEEMNNYRPISLLSTLSKVIEKVANYQMRQFIDKNNILYKGQFGFRPKYRTEDVLLKLINKITKAKHSNKRSLAVFVDLKKAFDTVDHEILLKKLEYYGFTGNSLQWFRSYLKDRKQAVKFKGSISDYLNMLCGVPQGSILGPLLFLIYINDLFMCLDLETFLFADDTTFEVTKPTLEEASSHMNSQLEIATNWFNANKLSLHPKKTTFISFFPKHNDTMDNLMIMNQPIQKIHENAEEGNKSFKYVGIHLDENLSWKYHIDHIMNKIRKNLYMINRAKRNIPQDMKRILYAALIQPHMDYCNAIWGGARKNITDKIEKIQKRAIRIITGSKYNAHTKELFQDTKFLPLKQLIILNEEKLAYRLWHNTAPPYVLEDFTKKPQGSTRLQLQFEITFTNSEKLRRLPLYRIPNCWNNLEPHLKVMKAKQFVTQNKKLLLEQL